MNNLLWFTDEQMAWLHFCFPKLMAAPREGPTGSDQDNLIQYQRVSRTGCATGISTTEDTLQPLEATDVSRVRHWFEHARERGVFTRIMEVLAAEASAPKTVMADATTSRRTTGDQSAGENGERGRPIDRAKSGMNIRLHAITDVDGRPIRVLGEIFPLDQFPISTHDRRPSQRLTGAAARVGSLFDADGLLVEGGYDADLFREALRNIGIRPCIPEWKSRGKPVKYDKRQHRRRDRI